MIASGVLSPASADFEVAWVGSEMLEADEPELGDGKGLLSFDSVRLTLFLPCSAAAQASRTQLSDEDMDATSAPDGVVTSQLHLCNFMACAAARSLSCSFTMSDGLSAE